MWDIIKKLKKLMGAFLSSCLFLMVVQCTNTSKDNSALFVLLGSNTSKSSFSTTDSTTDSCSPDTKTPVNYSNIALFNKVKEAPGATGSGFGDPNKAINGIRGCGKLSGSLDVYSLKSSSSSNYCEPNKRCIVLEVENKKVKDGAGIDIVIFENGFCNGGESNCGTSHFMEPIIVEVSYDGTNWCGWNPRYIGSDTTDSSLRNPNNWLRFAGIWPVIYNQDNWLYTEDDIFDREKAGGDGFDLSDSNFGKSGDGCDLTVKNQILTNGFIYLRLTSANSRGLTYDPISIDQTPDIDGAIARYVQNR